MPIKLSSSAKYSGTELILTARAKARNGAIKGAPAGTMLGWSQFVLEPAKAAVKSAPAVKPVRSGDEISLTSAAASLAIDAKTGLVRYSAGGKTLLKGGSPNFWRALTDNDAGIDIENTHAVWKRYTAKRNVRAVDVGADS